MRGTAIVLVLMFLLALALVAIALLLTVKHPTTGARVGAALASAIAGGLLGSSVSIFVASHFDAPVLEQVRALLERTAACRLNCSEQDLIPLRKVWHHYHVTLIHKDKPVWRYSRLPFDNHSTVGSLTSDLPVVDAVGAGPPHRYKLDAAVWARRVVLMQTRVEGDEAAAVEIFPDMAGFGLVHAGIAVMQSWTHRDVLVPVLVSSSPLLESAEPGTVDAEHSAKLEELWVEHFQYVERLIPPRSRRRKQAGKPSGPSEDAPRVRDEE